MDGTVLLPVIREFMQVDTNLLIDRDMLRPIAQAVGLRFPVTGTVGTVMKRTVQREAINAIRLLPDVLQNPALPDDVLKN